MKRWVGRFFTTPQYYTTATFADLFLDIIICFNEIILYNWFMWIRRKGITFILLTVLFYIKNINPPPSLHLYFTPPLSIHIIFSITPPLCHYFDMNSLTLLLIQFHWYPFLHIIWYILFNPPIIHNVTLNDRQNMIPFMISSLLSDNGLLCI